MPKRQALEELERELSRYGQIPQEKLDCYLHTVAVGHRDEQPELRISLCSKLLSRGAQLNNRQHNCGGTPLFHAVMGGHSALIDLLLEKSADADVRNSYGPPALG